MLHLVYCSFCFLIKKKKEKKKNEETLLREKCCPECGHTETFLLSQQMFLAHANGETLSRKHFTQYFCNNVFILGSLSGSRNPENSVFYHANLEKGEERALKPYSLEKEPPSIKRHPQSAHETTKMFISAFLE